MAAPNDAFAINYRATETVQHRNASRFLAGTGTDETKLKAWLDLYTTNLRVSTSTYVVVNDHFDKKHPEGTDDSVKVIMLDASGAYFTTSFRNLADGKLESDVRAAFTATGVLLPSSGAQCTACNITIRDLEPSATTR